MSRSRTEGGAFIVPEVAAEVEPTRWPYDGYHVLPIEQAIGASVASEKDEVCWRRFKPPADMVVTSLAMSAGTTPGSGSTLIRFALYHVGLRYGATGLGRECFTPVARTASDTAIFTVGSTLYTRALSATGGWPSRLRLIGGETYAMAYLVLGGTASQVVAGTAPRPQVIGAAQVPPAGGRAAGLGAITDLPGYWAGSSWSYSTAAVTWSHLICDSTDVATPRPLRTALMGDSYFSSYAGWLGLGNAQSGSHLLPTLNAGVGSETSTQMVARLSALEPYAPEVIVIHGGINDIAGGVAATTVQDNVTTMLTFAEAQGAKAIVCTGPPTTSMDAGELTQLAALNTWIKALSVPNVWAADTGNALTTGDGVTRDAALFVDGAHPNVAGQQAMADVLDGVIPTVVAA